MALGAAERRFLLSRRVGYLATADAACAPHVVPVCFAAAAHSIYITIDEKPKTVAGAALKRLRNIAQNPRAALLVDRYDDADWSRLAWLMVRGPADILEQGSEHDEAQELLRGRYPQLRAMALDALPVIRIRIERVTGWGDLG